jgi:hypothetical protein
LKLKGGLQEAYELRIKIFVVSQENGYVTLVKQEEAGPNSNVKFEDSHSQIAGQEHSEKPESNQSHSQEEPCQTEDSNSGNSKIDVFYSPVKPETICHEEELAR